MVADLGGAVEVQRMLRVKHLVAAAVGAGSTAEDSAVDVAPAPKRARTSATPGRAV